MTDVIRVHDIRVRTHIGCTQEERHVGQVLRVDLELHLDTRVAAEADALDASLDYAAASRAVVDALSDREFHLLETAAEAAAGAVVGLGAEQVTLRLRKPSPPMDVPVAWAEVEITRP